MERTAPTLGWLSLAVAPNSAPTLGWLALAVASNTAPTLGWLALAGASNTAPTLGCLALDVANRDEHRVFAAATDCKTGGRGWCCNGHWCLVRYPGTKA